MAYKDYIYRLGNSNEHEIRFKGLTGAKGEKRTPKKKRTSEEIARINQINKEVRVRRLLKLNFQENDMWCCFKYPSGTRLSVEEIMNDRKYFMDRLRIEYAKAGETFKWISRLEVGEHGGLHFHMVMNRIWNVQTDVIISKCWKRTLERSFKRRKVLGKTDGLADYKTMYEAGGFDGLAKYICKKPEKDTEEYHQLSLFKEPDRRKLTQVSTSRNLVRPVPEIKEYKVRTVKKIIEEGPKPTKGYYIDWDSIVKGVNPFTGLSYIKYSEIKLEINEERPRDKRGVP